MRQMAVESKGSGGHDAKKPVRAMIVGDSMTEGSEGDWTWRYRMWEWFTNNEVAVKFVGPYVGTQESGPPLPPKPPALYGKQDPPGEVQHNGGYAVGVSKDFDSHHFSTWGRQAAQSKDEIKDVVSKHPADILLVMLGFNDVGWWVSDAPGTLESMKGLIHNARAANPDIKLAVANIPQRTFMEGRDDLPTTTDKYNKLLAEAIPKLSTEKSPIHLVKLREEYVAEDGSYDGLHPNSLGDYQIARAFSLSLLHDFKLGHEPLSIPKHIPPRPLPTPSNFQVFSSPVGVTATWDKVYGTQGYEIRQRTKGKEEFDTGGSIQNRWDSHWTGDGTVYEIQVRSQYGNTARSDWTPVLSATAHPQTAAAPENIVIKQNADGFHVSWDPPKGPNTDSIIQYSVLWHDHDIPGFFFGLAGFVESPAQINEFEKGHRYNFMMLTWNAAGEGRPGPGQEVTFGKRKSDDAKSDEEH